MQTDTSVLKLDINLIIPNKYQPRKVFDEKELTSLSESIKTYGIINPILVRKKEDKYEIIAGERRFRAAKQVGLTKVPVIVKDADEQQMAELALIENIQRQGLSPIEEAKSYEEIMRIGNQTQSSLAEKLGKSQSAIANKIRLLSLPQEIQDALANKKISERHARSLIKVEDKEEQLELLDRIIKERLTVKETEQIINESEISEEEIKKAISDIMKSLNIEEEKEDEKEDDNMNNGNFFPNFDNNNAANANASLNMMNMQSMNQQPMAPEPEMVMPTMNQPIPGPMAGPELVAPPQPIQEPQMEPTPSMGDFSQFGPTMAPDMNNGFMTPPQNNFQEPIIPTIEPPMMETPAYNEPAPFGPIPGPMAGPELVVPTQPAEESTPVIPQETFTAPMQDVPLFNPNVVMPTVNDEPQMVTAPSMGDINQFGPVVTPELSVPTQPVEEPMMSAPSFDIPVATEESVSTAPVDRLTELQNLLLNNGYNFKTFTNDTEDCIIIEIPKF